MELFDDVIDVRHRWWKIPTKTWWTRRCWANFCGATSSTVTWKTTTWPTRSTRNSLAEFGGSPDVNDLGAPPCIASDSLFPLFFLLLLFLFHLAPLLITLILFASFSFISCLFSTHCRSLRRPIGSPASVSSTSTSTNPSCFCSWLCHRNLSSFAGGGRKFLSSVWLCRG